MGKGINKVTLLGHLGQEPDYKVSSSGAGVCVLSVATSESWKDGNGVKQEKTEWHRVVAFKQLADICQKYLAKGDQVYCEGQLRTRKWTDNQNQERYTTEIVLNELVKTSRSTHEGGQQYSPAPAPAPAPPQFPQEGAGVSRSPYAAVPHAQDSRPAAPVNPLDSYDDDIPF